MIDRKLSGPFGADERVTVQTDSTEAGRASFRSSVINLDRPGDPSVFDDTTRAEAAELIARYPEGQQRSALLPMLHLVQSVQGHVTVDGIAFCADQLGLAKSEVASVLTYYTMFKRKPTGEYLVSVCTNTLCGMLGGDEIYAALREQLGFAPGEDTTPDGKITIEHAECLAACDYAPVLTVNYEYFDNQTVGSARNITSQLQSGDVPEPTRGAPLCTFRAIERQIAGFFDDEAARAPEAGATGAPTEAGVRLATARDESAPSYSLGDGADVTVAEQKSDPLAQQPTSGHDAPLKTAASDPEHPAKPTGGEGQ